MHYRGETIREFKTKNFRVIAQAFPEDEPVDVDDDGETQQAVDKGIYVHFRVEVRVLYKGNVLGTDHLGGCIYESIADFMDHKECGEQNRKWAEQGESARCGSYFTDMINIAIAEARKTLADYRNVYVRN